MPNALVLRFSQETGKPVSEVERLWRKAKKLAVNRYRPTHKRYYPYVVGILKKMLKLNESSLQAQGSFDSPNLDTIDYQRASSDRYYFFSSLHRVASDSKKVPYFVVRIFDWNRRLDAESYFKKEGVLFCKVPGSVDLYYVEIRDAEFLEGFMRWMSANAIDYELVGVVFNERQTPQ